MPADDPVEDAILEAAVVEIEERRALALDDQGRVVHPPPLVGGEAKTAFQLQGLPVGHRDDVREPEPRQRPLHGGDGTAGHQHRDVSPKAAQGRVVEVVEVLMGQVDPVGRQDRVVERNSLREVPPAPPVGRADEPRIEQQAAAATVYPHAGVADDLKLHLTLPAASLRPTPHAVRHQSSTIGVEDERWMSQPLPALRADRDTEWVPGITTNVAGPPAVQRTLSMQSCP